MKITHACRAFFIKAQLLQSIYEKPIIDITRRMTKLKDFYIVSIITVSSLCQYFSYMVNQSFLKTAHNDDTIPMTSVHH